MTNGTVKWFNDHKGFGFIEGDQDDAFFHHSAVVGTTFDQLKEGQMVEYEMSRGPKGPRAENVRPVEPSAD